MRIAMILSLSFLAACAKDRTVEDYNHEQRQQFEAKMQAVQGHYRGVITSKSDRSTIGALEIEVSPDTQSVSSSGTQLQAQASLQGQVTLTDADGVSRILNFKKGAFDPTDNSFRASAPVGNPASPTGTIELAGQFQDGTLTGQLQSAGYGEYGGSFHLTLNGIVPSAAVLRDSSKPQENAIHEFSGIASNGRPYDLVIFEAQNSTTEEQFLDLFQPVKSVDVQIHHHVSTEAATDFPAAQLDLRTGRLSGKGVRTGASPYNVLLKCVRVSGAGGELDWSCQYSDMLAGGRRFTILFRPAT